MQITKKELEEAVAQGIISSEQSEALVALWSKQQSAGTRFDLPNVAYYFGGLIILSAMGWFMTNAWERFGGWGMAGIALLYALCFIIAGMRLWERAELRVPAGIMIVLAVCMTPLVIYGVERGLGWWPEDYPGYYRHFYHWIRGGWIWMEVGTVACAILALRFFPVPLLTAPLAITLYFMSLDIAPLLGPAENPVDARWVSLVFGAALTAGAFYTDYQCRRHAIREDYAFWTYLLGAVAFWGALTALDRTTELAKGGYCLINLAFVLFSILVQRRIFLIFGVLGVLGYIGDLAYRLFADSLLFSFVLVVIGCAVIYLGMVYRKYQVKIHSFIRLRVPDAIRKWLPS